jgi:hypothetical protein
MMMMMMMMTPRGSCRPAVLLFALWALSLRPENGAVQGERIPPPRSYGDDEGSEVVGVGASALSSKGSSARHPPVPLESPEHQGILPDGSISHSSPSLGGGGGGHVAWKDEEADEASDTSVLGPGVVVAAADAPPREEQPQPKWRNLQSASVSGDTTGAPLTQGMPASCALSLCANNCPGLFYRVVGSGLSMTASTCGTASFNQRLYVWDGDTNQRCQFFTCAGALLFLCLVWERNAGLTD